MDKKARVLLLLMILVMGVRPAGMAQSQAGCGRSTINSARDNYDIGQFDACISVLRPCLNYFKENKMTAYKYMALCYLAMDNFDSADVYIDHLLGWDEFQVESGDPVRFQSEVAKMLSKNGNL